MLVLRRFIFLLVASLVLATVAASSAGASPRPGDEPPGGGGGGGSAGDLSAEPLPVTGTTTTDKAPSSRLAEPDRRLLARTDGAQVSVFVKLDADPVASYAGGVDGLAATSPSVTGRDLAGRPAERAYERYLAGKESDFVTDLRRVVPGADIDLRLRTVYGGVVTTIPADAAKQVQKLPGVVAVQRDQVRQPLTDASGTFIGAPTLYDQLGSSVPDAGKGQILGNLDSGVWPEHPSFADRGNLPAPPGPARACQYGDNPLTPAPDPFVCTNKLIGGAAFTKAYDAQVGDDPYAGTARDSEGHGTHTATTSAGDPVTGVSIAGKSLPDIHGIAPGAAVMEYKVCGPQGCFSSDSAAAVQQAVKDGVNAINFSVSGGTDPYTDPVELAFLDAYGANVFVSASAGNEGPGAGTVNHVSPWTTSVAASTQTREFGNTLTLTGGGDTFTADGVSITKGVGPTPVVLGSAAPYGSVLCDRPAAAGTFTGKIVICERGGNGRLDKSYNVSLGGAAGMILYNPTLADVETDNHFVPAIHIADGTALLAFVRAHPTLTGSFTEGQPRTGQGDVMASFSSRGPGGPVLKPDLSAPGVQILAGMTPTPKTPADGPAGQYFQAIAGTSMSAPHVAGAALLLHALHPEWTPGQIRSALMTTAVTSMVKDDLKTPADPLDRGAGRIDLTKAGSAALTFDETAARMQALGMTPKTAVDLNLPSIDAPTMPGSLTTVRTARNTTDRAVTFRAQTSASPGSTITVSPSTFTVQPGASVDLSVTIRSPEPTGRQEFGQVDLVPGSDSGPALHLPVAFVPRRGTVSLASSCAPASVTAPDETSTCTVTATNQSENDVSATLTTKADDKLAVTGADNADVGADGAVTKGPVTLRGSNPGVPQVSTAASTPGGYVPLDSLGVRATPVGDEELVSVDTPAFRFAGRTYTSISVSSNGYVKAGPATAADQNCCNLPTGPDRSPPNGMIAPFWTDLDGTGAPGIFTSVVTDNGTGKSWMVVEHRVNVFGTKSLRTFETWIGLNGTEDVTMTYPANDRPAAPGDQPFLVGAENDRGEGAMSATAPSADLRVTSTDPRAGDSVSYAVTVQGRQAGTGHVTTTMTDSATAGETEVSSPVEVSVPAGPTAAPLMSSGTGDDPQMVTVPVPPGGSVTLLDAAGKAAGSVTVQRQGTYRIDAASGVITFTPTAGFVGTATPVRYRVTDRYSQSAESTYTPTVRAASGPPKLEVVVPPTQTIDNTKGVLSVPVTCAVSVGRIRDCGVAVTAVVNGRYTVLGSAAATAPDPSRGATSITMRVRLRPGTDTLAKKGRGLDVTWVGGARTPDKQVLLDTTRSRLVTR